MKYSHNNWYKEWGQAMAAISIIIFISIGYVSSQSYAFLGKTKCQYEILATVSKEISKIDTKTRLIYQNTESEILYELVVRFDSPKKSFSAFDESGKMLTVSSFVDSNSNSPKGYFVIKLPVPVKSDQVIKVDIVSETPVLERYGIKYLEGCWHPKIVNRNKGVWNISYEEFADYKVTLTPVSQALIPTSGQLVSHDKDEDGNWILTFKSSNIPDFGVVLSHSDYVVSDTQDNITINCFYLRDKAIAERMIDVAKDVIRFYGKMYGFYPDSVLNIIAFDGNGFGGGPIGSNIVQVNKTFEQNENSTIWAIAHEIAHEYWGWNWVVDSNPNVAWLCLGMGLWSDLQYMEMKNKEGQNFNILYDYIDATKRGLNTKLQNPTSKDLSNRINEKSLAHSKGYAIALMLEYLMNEDAFYKVAKATLERFAHQAITAEKFQSTCEEISGQKLDWFFQQWVYTNNTLDYAVTEVETIQDNSTQQVVVSVEAKAPALMPLDILLEFADGSVIRQRLPQDKKQSIFVSDKTWQRVMIDPSNYLPDTNISNNVTLNSQVASAIEILDIDIGDKAWGLNLLKVHAKNTTDQKRTLKVHIGAGKRRVPSGCGFGMGEKYVIAPKDDRWIEHWYWLPPGHGLIDAIVTFRDLIEQSSDNRQKPFLTKEYQIDFPIPNNRCNNLTITEKLPIFKEYYKGVKHLDSFEYFITEHFVFYCSPNTPAHKNIKKLMIERELALKKVCHFAGTVTDNVIIVFFYPDQITKRMCTMHTGNGLARGNMIAEVYNDEVKLDPYHELTHVVMGQIGNPPAMFNEGLATYMQTGHIWKGKHIDTIAAGLLRNDRLIPLTDLIARVEIGSKPSDGQIAYPQSASFMKFLIDNYTKEQFLEAYGKLKNGHQERNILYIQEIFGCSLDELGNKWHDVLTKSKQI